MIVCLSKKRSVKQKGPAMPGLFSRADYAAEQAAKTALFAAGARAGS